jgi:hypothetical protein
MAEYHVEDSLVPITKGKEGLRGFGFEPAFNEFYDLYASDRVLSKPILRLEDIALYLYLRKCVNVERDDWRPPSIRHLARKFKIGSGKVYRILERLEKAHLLRRVSGVRESGNMPNQYTLFDPLSEEEFVRAAEAGALPASVRDDWRGCARERTEGVPEAEQGVYLARNRGVPEAEQGVYLRRNRGVPEAEQGCSVSGTITDLSETDLLETDLEQTDTIAAVSELLLDFADDCDEHLAREVADQLAARATLEQVEGWIDYVEHKGESLTSPLAFLISKLRKGEPPPDVRTYRELTFRDVADSLRMGAMRDSQRGVLEARGVAPETAGRLLDVWSDVLSSVRNQTTAEIFETWFSETVLLEEGDGRTVIGVPSDRHQHLLGDRMRPLIERAFRYKGCEIGQLVFEVYDQGGETCTS